MWFACVVLFLPGQYSERERNTPLCCRGTTWATEEVHHLGQRTHQQLRGQCLHHLQYLIHQIQIWLMRVHVCSQRKAKKLWSIVPQFQRPCLLLGALDASCMSCYRSKIQSALCARVPHFLTSLRMKSSRRQTIQVWRLYEHKCPCLSQLGT